MGPWGRSNFCKFSGAIIILADEGAAIDDSGGLWLSEDTADGDVDEDGATISTEVALATTEPDEGLNELSGDMSIVLWGIRSVCDWR